MSMTNWSGGCPNSMQPIFVQSYIWILQTNSWKMNQINAYLFVPISSQCPTLCLYSTWNIWKIQITRYFVLISWIWTIFITLDACIFFDMRWNGIFGMKHSPPRNKNSWRIHNSFRLSESTFYWFEFDWIMAWKGPISLESWKNSHLSFSQFSSIFSVTQQHFSVHFVSREWKIGNCCHRNGDSKSQYANENILYKPEQMALL